MANVRKMKVVDYVFDIYTNEPSAKDSERMRRTNSTPIELSSVKKSTSLSKDMATLWPSSTNKQLLEKLIYKHIVVESEKASGHRYPTVISQVITQSEEWQCTTVHEGRENATEQLQSCLDEADFRIPIHVLDSLEAGHKICVVISNYTDVIVSLLYHMPCFLQHGIEELWVRAGTGDTTRYVPLHTLYQRIGHRLCSVLPAVHSLTGCDITSKVGTKKAALKANPEIHLKCFGTSLTLPPTVFKSAEMFLVKVLKRVGSDAKTFTQLRAELFHSRKTSSHQNLPPTSQGAQLHILRAFFNAYNIIHVLDSYLNSETAVEVVNPEDYGFELNEGQLIPSTMCKTLEARWTVVCSCEKCVRSTCPCRMAEVKCCRFCKCKKNNSCKNPILFN